MKLQGSADIEMYISDAGYLVIKAESYEYGRINTFLFNPDQTKLFYQLLPDMIEQQKTKWTGIYKGIEE
jgi:hypothetical protein